MKRNRIFKLILFMAVILIIGCQAGCGKREAKNVAVADIARRLSENAEIPSAELEDLTDIENAEKYLLSTDDIEEGIAVYSKSTEQADKIIVIKAKDKKTVQDVERGLTNVLNGLINTWENDDREGKKVEEHILKTNDKYVMLYVGQKNEEAEKIFDDMLK